MTSFGGRAGQRQQKNHQRGHRNGNNSIIRATGPANHKYERPDDRDLHAERNRKCVEQRGGKEQADIGSCEAQETAAEGGGEIGLEDDGDRHRDPVRARDAHPSA